MIMSIKRGMHINEHTVMKALLMMKVGLHKE